MLDEDHPSWNQVGSTKHALKIDNPIDRNL